MTGTRFENDNYHKYDLREPPRKIIHPSRFKDTKIDHITDDWSNIPFYPTMEKKNEMIKKYGKQEAEKIIQYSYDNSTDPTKEVIPPLPPSVTSDPNKVLKEQASQAVLKKIQLYNEAMLKMNSPQRIIPTNINKFSPAYARIIAAKPRASSSANIRLGGVYR
jgi:hypothetical protein